jgi:hypothetical protein
MIFGEKIELKAVYVNQHDSVSDIQTPSRSLFILCFLHELLMLFTISYVFCTVHCFNVQNMCSERLLRDLRKIDIFCGQ